MGFDCGQDYGQDFSCISTLLCSTEQEARKVHQCCECHRGIRIGESYFSDSVACDGSVVRHKTCMHCKAVREFLVKRIHGYTYTALLDDMLSYGPQTSRAFNLIQGIQAKWTVGDSLMPYPDA